METLPPTVTAFLEERVSHPVDFQSGTHMPNQAPDTFHRIIRLLRNGLDWLRGLTSPVIKIKFLSSTLASSNSLKGMDMVIIHRWDLATLAQCWTGLLPLTPSSRSQVIVQGTSAGKRLLRSQRKSRPPPSLKCPQGHAKQHLRTQIRGTRTGRGESITPT